MKIGMNMLLWTGHVSQEHVPILKALKATGFDGVEVPVFDVSDEAHYRRMAAVLDDLGLERTVVAIIPDEAHSPISPDATDASSTSQVRSGMSVAMARKPPAGPVPYCCRTRPARASASGEYGRMIPDSARTFSP